MEYNIKKRRFLMGIEGEFLLLVQEAMAQKPRGFQTKTANKLGIKPSSFSNMLSGRRGMDETQRIFLSKMLDIDYAKLREKYEDKATNIINVGDHSTAAVNQDSPGSIVNLNGGNNHGELQDERISQLVSILEQKPFLIDAVLEWTKRRSEDF
jgi:DNA-binding transcriptional regulator YdaS (Cro superfamily)